MSHDTKAALDAAIQAHLADEGHGDVTTAWLLISNSTDLAGNGEGMIWLEYPDGQPTYIRLGLVEAATVLTRGFVYASMVKNQAEDDE